MLCAMDPVTHAATGLLAAQAASPALGKPRGLIPFCLAAALLPDLDNFGSGGDPGHYLLYHRALSHSLLAAPVLALALAGAWKALRRETPLRQAWALALGLILGHLWLDYVTAYGTQLLAPFSSARLTLEAVFIIDPAFTASLLAAILAARLLPAARTRIALAALAWVLAYPLLCWSVRLGLEQHLAQRLHERGESFQSLRLSPEAFSPWYWKSVEDRGETYTLGLVRAFDPLPRPTRTYAKADRALLRDLGREADIFRTYDWFSLYPAVLEGGDGNRRVLTFLDLRFVSLHPLVQAVRGDDRIPLFSLTAVLDPTGRHLLDYSFRRQGEPVRALPDR